MGGGGSGVQAACGSCGSSSSVVVDADETAIKSTSSISLRFRIVVSVDWQSDSASNEAKEDNSRDPVVLWIALVQSTCLVSAIHRTVVPVPGLVASVNGDIHKPPA